MLRAPLSMAFAMALIPLCPALSGTETAASDAAFGWQQTTGMTALVASLDDWLDARSDWPRRDTPPRIRFISQWQAAARQGATASFQRARIRGLYDPDLAEILLVRPWDRRSEADVAVLLHELAHHRQAPHHWYCPAAQELSAYRLQEEWLSEQGHQVDVNWVAVVLDAGCSPRDIHPE
ncbi:DUF6647 family protein [Pseudooceanicola sp.]|uniref:DUF6647 family protein n=1 Tax=Pseudooceanicola sp. TaxID=1914328 RepID=UPI00405A23A4